MLITHYYVLFLSNNDSCLIFLGVFRRRPPYPGEVGLGKVDIYSYFHRSSIVEPRQTGEGVWNSRFCPDVLYG